MFYKFVKFINKLKTAYRRIKNPAIRKNYWVIEWGSGDMPNPRADVICDSIEENTERITALKTDRPFIWADIENLPFRDKAFDYSIASHVIEHVDNPECALRELERISRAGYIETPNAFYEFAIPHMYHLSRCTAINNKLIIFKKERWDETVDKKYFDIRYDMNKCWWNLHNLDAQALLTAYHWKNKIDYEIHGGKSFKKPKDLISESNAERPPLQSLIIKLVYWFLKPRKKIDLKTLLVCPKCKGDLIFEDGTERANCQNCNLKFRKHKGFLDFRLL